MIEHTDDITKLAAAMHAAQKQLTGVKKDSTNPHYRSKYASLEAVIETVRGPLNEHGVWFTQAPGRLTTGTLEVTTMLIHAPTGQWMRSTMDVPLSKMDPQGAGAATTYACRYALMAMLGIAPVDDDGEAAVRTNAAPAPARPQYSPDRITTGPLEKHGLNEGPSQITERPPEPPSSKYKRSPKSSKETAEFCIEEIRAIKSVHGLEYLGKSEHFRNDIKSCTASDADKVRAEYAAQLAALKKAEGMVA